MNVTKKILRSFCRISIKVVISGNPWREDNQCYECRNTYSPNSSIYVGIRRLLPLHTPLPHPPEMAKIHPWDQYSTSKHFFLCYCGCYNKWFLGKSHQFLIRQNLLYAWLHQSKVKKIMTCNIFQRYFLFYSNFSFKFLLLKNTIREFLHEKTCSINISNKQ